VTLKNPSLSAQRTTWAGGIPKDWALRRLKYVAPLINQRTEQEGLPYIGLEHVESWSGRLTGWPGDESPQGTSNVFRAGDVLFGKLRPYLAKALAVDFDGRCSPELLVLRPDGVDNRYLLYVLLSDEFIRRVDATTYGAKMPRANWADSGAKPIPLTPLDEQRAVADYLDEKTATIDALIAKRERHIELLEEKRQATVTQVMTTGITRPDSTKPSGIDWLGEIPSHWTAMRLRHVVPQITVGIVVTPSRYYIERGVPCLRSLNVRPNGLLEDDLVYISPESNELHRKSVIHQGDLVAVRTGNPGTTAVVDERFDGGNVIDLIIVRQSPAFDSEFLSYFMNSSLARHQFASGSEGALQLHFNVETAKDLLISLPPLNEQRQISAHLSEINQRTDRLLLAIQTQIARLREYRQTLISAAVTGQIPVREEVPA
jgi:type I restriction enzyme S subunit